MSTPPDPVPEVRIGNAERESATNALDEHLSAGRLDPDEYADRMVKVSVARTFGDLAPLFADLPAPHPGPPSMPRPAVGLTKGPANDPARRDHEDEERALGGRWGETFVALSPFIALALFFLTPVHSWLVFLLIPVAGVLVYGTKDRKHNRDN